uniref:Secreted protein n=1 Tax=Anopheles darlingi TaxID=43151 RepID=A0A2M4DK91_ANODA
MMERVGMAEAFFGGALLLLLAGGPVADEEPELGATGAPAPTVGTVVDAAPAAAAAAADAAVVVVVVVVADRLRLRLRAACTADTVGDLSSTGIM